MAEPVRNTSVNPDLRARATTSPVLFLIFNRPDATARVLNEIRCARPPRFYIAADGPRSGNASDAERCAEARRVALAVDWSCEVRTLFRVENLGCRRAVTDALDWFFDAEPEGIVLEDDCCPDPTFFPYCDELLTRWRDDSRVFSISGSNFQDGRVRGSASYVAGKHFHCWGWASWRRAWVVMHPDQAILPSSLDAGLRALADGSPLFAPYWRQIARLCVDGVVDSWDYRTSLACFALWGRGMTPTHLHPQSNLVSNLGFDGSGAHTSGDNPAASTQSLVFPLTHPDSLCRDVRADRFTDRRHFGLRWMPWLRRQVGLRFPIIDRFIRLVRQGVA